MDSLNKSTTLLKIFIGLIKKYPKQYSFLLVMLFCEGALAVMSVLAIAPLAEFLGKGEGGKVTAYANEFLDLVGMNKTIIGYGIIFFVLILFKNIFEIFLKYFILKTKYTILSDLVGSSLLHFFQADYSFFSKSEKGILLNTLHKEINSIGDGYGNIALILVQYLQIIIYLSVPFIVNAKITLMIVTLAAFFSLPFIYIQKKSYSLGRLNLESSNKATNIISESIGAAKLILGYGNHQISKDRYIECFKIHSSITIKSQLLIIAVYRLYQPLAILSAIIGIHYAFTVDKEEFSNISIIMWSFIGLMPLASSVLQGKSAIASFIPSYIQLVELIRTSKKIKSFNGLQDLGGDINNISLENSYFYYENGIECLRNINLEIKKGNTISIIGQSGAGKSTLLNLIMGIAPTSKGAFKINNIDIKSLKIDQYKKLIGYVPQDPILFNDSVLNNLLWANPSATKQDIKAVLDLVNASEFINSLPKGINTEVGDRGSRLSGGQRQKIAIARALLRRPKLLIFDEATNSIDGVGEETILQNINNFNKDCIKIFVTHNESTLKYSNSIYLVDAGSVKDLGRYENLDLSNISFIKKNE